MNKKYFKVLPRLKWILLLLFLLAVSVMFELAAFFWFPPVMKLGGYMRTGVIMGFCVPWGLYRVSFFSLLVTFAINNGSR